ncbi:hypothetical protein [Halostagnicola sp. A-GB9-2]|uniref:hypothetical protein n=1 Tax=Halostagnicola sp. A-GB9-2 TaxID=3048066 RepID=UPI0024BF7610|nr:hypothetical protein [Halostagnicola sp. A-GB9-2]MDJ1434618.1 hypothetical protein [Halostagnicola sp. A-GB9-2]
MDLDSCRDKSFLGVLFRFITRQHRASSIFAMLLIEQEQITKDEVIETAMWYEIEALIERIYQFIEGEFATTDDVGISVLSAQEYAALKEHLFE